MFEWFSTLFTHFSSAFTNQESVRTATITLATGAVIGGVSILLVRIPSWFMNTIWNQLYTELSFNSSSASDDDYNQKQYMAFLVWLSKNKWFGYLSRTITIDSADDGDDDNKYTKGHGPGLGTHVFFWKRRLFWVYISEKESQGTSISKYHISIKSLGRSHKPLLNLLNEFSIKSKNDNSLSIYKASEDYWRWMTYGIKRDINTIFINDGIVDNILSILDRFIKEKDWYRQNGLNYKIAILLYGPPGTGKSTLIRSITSYLNRTLYIYEHSSYKRDNLSMLLQSATGGVVCMEDIDSVRAVRSREDDEDNLPVDDEREQPNTTKVPSQIMKFNVDNGESSSILNAIDGVVGLDDVIIFATTNYPHKLDNAFLRDGRIDYRIEIPTMNRKTIDRFTQHYYNRTIPSDINIKDIPGATIQKYFLENRDDYDRFQDAIVKHRYKKL
ncbi:ATPase [Xenorhabdus vietnamensis]|uniref:ATPase n=1 Tax=Xenorhabdus vietnamensis TaxID=351656 RepID=A0A1Y2SCF6_9GAMM|nr:AAA family ATPase [Xenorhabdus vietnamensis]OTA16428.1 ATPase [Xenorhabdus vietnamensis]